MTNKGVKKDSLSIDCKICQKDNTETLARMVKYLKGDLINEE